MASPRSPRDKAKATAKDTSTVRFIDFDEKQPSVSWAGISEREAARQVWLDKERDREVNYLGFDTTNFLSSQIGTENFYAMKLLLLKSCIV